jgi:kynureninase
LLKAGFESLDLDPAIAHVEPVPEDRRGGFLALRCARPGDLAAALRARGVLTDFRGSLLRLGPAPYVSDEQLRQAIEALRDASRGALGQAFSLPSPGALKGRPYVRC